MSMSIRGRISAGDLRQPITFQTRAAGQDALGSATGAWVDSFTVWGKALPINGREFFASGQMQASVDVRFVVRYRTDINERMRIMWRNEPYEIVSPPIDTDGAREQLEIMAVNGIRDGR